MLTWISLSLFIAFLVVGAVDGVYFHIHRFRLWAQPEGWLEHVLHTVRAVLVPAMLWLIFVADGARLWPLAALVVVDLAATAADVVVESHSRAPLGGLPRAELAIHVAATILHVGALGFAFASLVVAGPVPQLELLRLVAFALIGAGALAAVHHIALAIRGVPMARRASAAC